GKRQDRSAAARPAREDLKDMEDIFKAPEKAAPEKDTKADSSFDEIVNDISNIGKDPDSQEADRMAPDSEAFSFDDFGDAGSKQDEVADESLEEISAEEALPKDAEFVDSTGDELVDTVGVLDASLDQPDFGFKDLAGDEGQQSPEDAVFGDEESEPAGESAEAETAAEASESSDAGQEPESSEFEDLGTLPDWSTGGLEHADDDSDLRSLPAFADDAADEDKTASNDDNLDMENRELSSFTDGDAEDGLDSPQAAETADVPAESSGESADLYPPAETSGVSEVLTEESGSADDDFDSLDLPSLNIFDEQTADSSADLTRSSFAADSTFDDSSAGTGDDCELPDLDFDEAVKEEAAVDFSLPDFDSSSSSSAFDDFDATLSSTTDDWPSLDIDSTKSSSTSSYMPSNMFDDLYDKETMEGKSSDGYEDDRNSTRVPMFVCIACAIICILCLFFLFVIPTQFNVLRRSNTQEISFHEQRGRPEGKLAVGGNEASGAKESTESAAPAAGQGSGRGQSSAGELIKPASPASVSAPLPKVESVPAKENEIVIASVPSHVVPETPVRNVKKIPDIQYTVVWGDTLWDIANAYYKNPWKYTELAEYNHLKNPNFIQTGSTLLIPAE
ncbi:MAG: LysM peptidoglycan-binding domain-containing protein, partial [Treponema sp.]|nr:LysM peptidoglycan-binding domain-containing protein [Treponema sp.]